MASLDDPRDPSGRLIAAGQVAGTGVFDPQGTRLGSVLDVMLDKYTGRIAYAVLTFGGFLGIGDKRHPMPWDSMHYDEGLGGYVVNLDRARLEGAPAYGEGEPIAWGDEAWGQRLRDYYGRPGPEPDAVA